MPKKKVEKFIAENAGVDFNSSITIGEYRSGIDDYIEKANADFLESHVKCPAISVESMSIQTSFSETRIHLYRPTRLSSDKLASCIIYFTGSGFVYSNPRWQARNCIDLAISTNSIVLNIEEKSAPECRFPYGLEECFAVIKWLFDKGGELGINVTDIRLCGFSSGGNFAAVLARWCMERSLPIRGQYLISPWLDLTRSHDSYQRFAEGYLLDAPVCDWLRNQYAEPFQFESSDVSPLLFSGDTQRLAPCTLIIAECEPFHDEVIVYASRLRKSGVETRLIRIPDQIHEYAGCNRWRLVSEVSEDPISQVALAIKADRSKQLGTMPYETSISYLSPASMLYNSSAAFFRRLHDEYLIEHRNDSAKDRRSFDERFGIVPFNS